MKISEVIESLSDIRHTYGDLDAEIITQLGYYAVHEVFVEFYENVPEKPSHVTFANKRLLPDHLKE